jgi:hypothetical protein
MNFAVMIGLNKSIPLQSRCQVRSSYLLLVLSECLPADLLELPILMLPCTQKVLQDEPLFTSTEHLSLSPNRHHGVYSRFAFHSDSNVRIILFTGAQVEIN